MGLGCEPHRHAACRHLYHRRLPLIRLYGRYNPCWNARTCAAVVARRCRLFSLPHFFVCFRLLTTDGYLRCSFTIIFYQHVDAHRRPQQRRRHAAARLTTLPANIPCLLPATCAYFLPLTMPPAAPPHVVYLLSLHACLFPAARAAAVFLARQTFPALLLTGCGQPSGRSPRSDFVDVGC